MIGENTLTVSMCTNTQKSASQQVVILSILAVVIALSVARIALPPAPLPLDLKALQKCEAWYRRAHTARDSMSVAIRTPLPQALGPAENLRACAGLEAEFKRWKSRR